MERHSVADASTHLSGLIDRALAGGHILITRDGEVVAEIRPIPPIGRVMTPEVLDWIAAGRRGRVDPDCHAGQLVSAMRDEEWREPDAKGPD